MVSRSESYLFDIAAFYTKWHRDLADSQNNAGSIPNVSPTYWPLYEDNVTWPSTFLLVPDMLWDQYGDRRVAVRAYPAMKRWIEYMRIYLKNDTAHQRQIRRLVCSSRESETDPFRRSGAQDGWNADCLGVFPVPAEADGSLCARCRTGSGRG